MYEVGVGIGIIILNSNGKVLLILRNSDAIKADSAMHLEGTWTLPAGKVKHGETLYEAAIRKAKQEVNLDINDLEIVSIADDINEYAHFVTIGIIAKQYKGQVNLGNTEEHIDYNWYTLKELPENLCEPTKKIINNYLERKLYKRN